MPASAGGTKGLAGERPGGRGVEGERSLRFWTPHVLGVGTGPPPSGTVDGGTMQALGKERHRKHTRNDCRQ